jgi:hypothetical protein
MVRPGEVDHLKCERLGTAVARVSEGDQQSALSEGDELLPQDHSVEWMWCYHMNRAQAKSFCSKQ